ncbi:MAG: hypothetical protein CMJ19_03115 [Phycisphaeraceae bacterium]|nr:hypothetical protein [Phycisphaeraceae bacterium]
MNTTAQPFPDENNTAAVLVSFHPATTLQEHVPLILKQIRHLYIVDNASNDETRAWLRQLVDTHPDLTLIENHENKGIAAALNQGVLQASLDGYQWVLCLDQDSLITPDWLSTMQQIVDEFPKAQSIGLIGSNFTHPDGRWAYPLRADDPCYRQVLTVITSGTLLPLTTWQKAGPFDERYFIDLVDHEYCLRLKLLGFERLVSTQPILDHQLGNETPVHILGMTFRPSNHNATRRYYIARNRVRLTRTYWRTFPRFVLGQWWGQFRETLGFLLIERNKLQKLMAVLRGLCAKSQW